jgi:NAD+--asparagine ADP-ribosyltransferase
MKSGIRISTLILAVFFCLGAQSGVALADEEGQFKRALRQAGQDFKSAGKEAGKAAKSVGKQVGTGTGKAVKGIGQKIESEARRINEGKPAPKRSNASARNEKPGRS